MSSSSKKYMLDYTDYTAVAAEGARVILISCTRCGAAILRDPRDGIDTQAIHDAWHLERGKAEAVP